MVSFSTVPNINKLLDKEYFCIKQGFCVIILTCMPCDLFCKPPVSQRSWASAIRGCETKVGNVVVEACQKVDDFCAGKMWTRQRYKAKVWDLILHREFMLLRIAVAWATWCHSGILQEWREEEEQAFVLCGRWMPNKKHRQHNASHIQLHMSL